MASRKALAFQAKEGYRLLVAQYMNTPLTYAQLLSVLNLNNSKSARTILRKIRELAEADGQIIPWACPATGHTYTLAGEVQYVIDSALHARRIEDGVRRGRKKHYAFLEDREGELPESVKMTVQLNKQLDDLTEQVAGIAELATQAIVAARREARAAAE
jgi:hypothetical protein